MDKAWIIGGNPESSRINNDWYATNPEAVRMLLGRHPFELSQVLEPCVGAGHIANAIKEIKPGCSIDAIDIVDRGYPCEIADFLEWVPKHKYDTIITNPPYSLASEFIEKSINCLGGGGQLAMFLKIQFLEGQKRKKLFDKYPPRFVYVFRKRMQIFNEGLEINPKTGKPWSSLMCNAWFVWVNDGNAVEPVIRWLD